MEINAEQLLEKLFDFYNVSSAAELSDKIDTSQKTISNWKIRNAVNAIKKKCRELGIYNEIFGDIGVNNLQGSSFDNGSIGVNNGQNKNIHIPKEQYSDFDEIDELSKTLFLELSKKYKNNPKELQQILFKVLQDG